MKLVVKLSGKVLESREARAGVCSQLSRLVREGHRLLVVHGGGRQLTELCRRLGIPTVQHQGRRVTDEATLEVAKWVFSGVNRDLVASLLAEGCRAVGFAAFDGNLTRCSRRPPLAVEVVGKEGRPRTERVDFGLVGRIESVRPVLVHLLWEAEMLPVVSCLCCDDRGRILNINADTLAAELAVGLEVDRMMAVSDVEGIYLDPADSASLLRRLTDGQARLYLREGRFTEGMIPKVESALAILERGVGSFQVVSGLTSNGLLAAVGGRAGTLLTLEGRSEKGTSPTSAASRRKPGRSG